MFARLMMRVSEDMLALHTVDSDGAYIDTVTQMSMADRCNFYSIAAQR
jgi:hypothetical protein